MMKKLLLILFCLVFGFAQAQELGIVGPAANGWPGDDPTPDIMLTNNGDGTYSIEALALTTGSAKFREDQDWAVSHGGDTFPSGSITGGDIPVVAGVYDILVDLNANTYAFTDVATFDVFVVSGSALSQDLQLFTTDGEVYQSTVNQFVDGEIVFENENGDSYGSSGAPTLDVMLDGAPIAIAGGFYAVEFNLTALTYSLTVPTVGMVGPGISEWPGTNPTPDVVMTSVDNGLVYTLESQEFMDGEVKFRQNLAWDTNWGGSIFPSGDLVPNGQDNIMAVAGTYDVTFDRANLTYMFVTLSTAEVEFNELIVYPNPSKGNWHIQSGIAEINTVSIFSITGKLIKEMKVINQNEIEINASNLDTGMYMIKLSTVSGNTKTLKLIKQ